MVSCKGITVSIFTYETPKIVNIRSIALGVCSRLVQLIIIGYIVGYVIVYQKGYQDFSDVRGSVVMKLKGVTYTNISDEDFDPAITNKELYRRIWDVPDFVVPPSESGSIFVATNILITPNQTKSSCPEDDEVYGAICDPSNNSCTLGEALPNGNGVMTGECVPNGKGNHTCEINAWCPLELDVLPLGKKEALLSASKNFTLLIKNFVEFPKFKGSRRRNIKDTSDGTYLKNCRYDAVNNLDCPVFMLGDIVAWAGEDFEKLAVNGGVIAIIINWDCNFDLNWKYCFPTYSFYRMDDPEAKLAPGWNFRYAQYYNDDLRTLYKLYGIKFSVIIQGRAGQFRIIPLLLNIGAGLGLLSINVVLCDIVALYLMKKKQLYKSKKYEDVSPTDIPDGYDDLESTKPEHLTGSYPPISQRTLID